MIFCKTKEGPETVGYPDVFQMITNSKPSLIIFSKGENSILSFLHFNEFCIEKKRKKVAVVAAGVYKGVFKAMRFFPQ